MDCVAGATLVEERLPWTIIGCSRITDTNSGTRNELTCTLGVTESPGPIVWSAGSGSSNTIFTGTRWMTFTKLPVAFSGGSRLNAAPLPACTLSTCARNFLPPSASISTIVGWPGDIFFNCDSLKLATTQTSTGTMDKIVCPV